MTTTRSTVPPEHSSTEKGLEQDPVSDNSKGKVHNSENDDSIDPENEVQGVKLLLIHTAICLCTFLVGLDFNLIATAIPVITSEFNSIRDVGWYGAAFQLALCSTQSLAGKTYVLFPKKLMYLAYLAIFKIASLICALAPSSAVLIIGRAIAGLGASGMFAGGFVVLTTIIPIHKRAIWTSTTSSTFALASIVGPVLGGALTGNVTWRWCFYINLPIGGFAAMLIFLLLRLKPESSQQASLFARVKSLDGVGFALFSGAITMLLLAFQWGGTELPWGSSVIIGLFVGFAAVTAVFIYWQIRLQDDALIPPRLFTTHRNVWLICCSSFFVYGPFQLIIYWLPIWFQAVLRASPLQSGIDYFPTVISDVLASFLGSALVMHLGWWNPFLLFAEIMVCIGGGLLTTIYPEISSGHWIGYQIFGGIGYALATNLAHLGMQASLPKELVPLGASNLLMVISTSCSIFLAIGQAVFNQRLRANLAPLVPSSVIDQIISLGATDFQRLLDPLDLPDVITA